MGNVPLFLRLISYLNVLVLLLVVADALTIRRLFKFHRMMRRSSSRWVLFGLVMAALNATALFVK